MATTDILISGLVYLDNVTVSVNIAGIDMGDYVAANGTITVPATANPNFTASAFADWVAQVSSRGLSGPNMGCLQLAGTWYYVPITVGRKYTSTGQMLRPLTQADVRSQTGDALGKIRQGFQYSFLFSKTGEGMGGVGLGQFSVGTGFTPSYTTWPLNLRKKTNDAWAGSTPYNGVHWDHLHDDMVPSFDSQLTWSVSRPVGVTIEASAIHLHSEDR